jgi:hypothetical protein
MRVRTIVWLGAAASLAVAGPAAARQAHAHIGHVADSWGDTPDEAGLLPTAVAEAEIAAQHAGLAVFQPDDLASIKLHIGHVLNAVDPSVEPSGPGKGYGVLKAARGVVTHINLAASAPDASDNVKLHANHVATSATNVVHWAERIVELCGEIKATDDAGRAAELAREVQALTDAIVHGRDDNGDGNISWGENEGGLEQATFHLNLLKRGEGM